MVTTFGVAAVAGGGETASVNWGVVRDGDGCAFHWYVRRWMRGMVVNLPEMSEF